MGVLMYGTLENKIHIKKNKKKQNNYFRRKTGRSDTPELVDEIMNGKMMTSNAPLVSTPAGQHTVKESMEPISSYVCAPRRRESDDPHNSNDGNNSDEKDEGRRSRDHDRSRRRKRSRSRGRDTESRRNRLRSRGSRYITSVPKMPPLNPKNYWWNGNTKRLGYYIKKWKRLLDPRNYSAVEAV